MAAVFPSITIDRSNGSQRIPGFQEVIASIRHESAPSTPRDFVPPRGNSLVEFRMDQRPARLNLAPHELRLNTGGLEPGDAPMYHFQSPLSATLLSPQIGQTPIEPTSASSSASTQSMRSMRGGRQTRTKQPSSRPAAKRMRDTRDREGVAIQQMETDLEVEGCLADLKPLNANNKEEAGRRYPKADVLERYCELSNSRRRKLKQEVQKAKQDSRLCQAYERWVERWCSTLNKDARGQLEAMVAEIASSADRQPPLGQSFESSASFSTRSSISDYDRRSPSSAEWSTDMDHDLAATTALPHRPAEAFHSSRL